METKIFRIIFILFISVSMINAQPILIDHTCTDITQIPEKYIKKAKEQLHIAYGHTSHGSQLTDGMTGLVAFANNSGRGLALPENIFSWNNGGQDSALDLHDYAMSGDVGMYPTWYNNTVEYLDDPDNANINVVMWAWCGQVDEKYTGNHLWDEYFEPMQMLEDNYPDVTFIYMTDHLDFWRRANQNAANDTIRAYCQRNNKILYDFGDIESYGPDGTCYKENSSDDCNIYAENGVVLGNWAQEYQDSHEEGVDWYTCNSAHSEPFNANLKAYAAWWLFTRLAGWDGIVEDIPLAVELITFKAVFALDKIILSWQTESEINNQGFCVLRKTGNEQSWQEISGYKTNPHLSGQGSCSTKTAYNYADKNIEPFTEYHYKISNTDFAGNIRYSNILTIITNEILSTPDIPQYLTLNKAYPNPFNPLLHIRYGLQKSTHVRIDIFNTTGKKIITVFNGQQLAGWHTAHWNGTDISGKELSSGVYFYTIKTRTDLKGGKVVLIK